MTESYHHRILVEALADEIAINPFWISPPIIYADTGDGQSGSSPIIVGSNRPDVLARDLATPRYIVGEAKTASDIDNRHTFEQLASYFDFLRCQAEGELWMGVPWMSAGMATRICTLVRSHTASTQIPICIAAFMFGNCTMRRLWRE
jgi:hypothetical protein